jgi:hypothetical protein
MVSSEVKHLCVSANLAHACHAGLRQAAQPALRNRPSSASQAPMQPAPNRLPTIPEPPPNRQGLPEAVAGSPEEWRALFDAPEPQVGVNDGFG